MNGELLCVVARFFDKAYHLHQKLIYVKLEQSSVDARALFGILKDSLALTRYNSYYLVFMIKTRRSTLRPFDRDGS